MTSSRSNVQDEPAAVSDADRWYVHDGSSWTMATFDQSVDEPVSPVRRPVRTGLRYRPLWQWAALVALATALTLGWLLVASGTHGLPCH
jgi:hypothetical protein